MTSQLPHQFDKINAPPEHYSYIQHRRQVLRQIISPVAISAVLLIGFIIFVCLTSFNQGNDLSKLAAISTMWIIMLILVGGVVILVLLVAMNYLLVRLLGALPYYTGIAQDYAYIARGYIIRGADILVKPIIGLNGWLETIKEFFGRITP